MIVLSITCTTLVASRTLHKADIGCRSDGADATETRSRFFLRDGNPSRAWPNSLIAPRPLHRSETLSCGVPRCPADPVDTRQVVRMEVNCKSAATSGVCIADCPARPTSPRHIERSVTPRPTMAHDTTNMRPDYDLVTGSEGAFCCRQGSVRRHVCCILVSYELSDSPGYK